MQLAALKAVVIVGLALTAAALATVTPTAPEIVIVPDAPILITLITLPTGMATDELSGIVIATDDVLEYVMR
jgi:hypothetical protein